MGLEPHHRAGRTRSWREEVAIAAWAATRPAPAVEPQEPPNGAGPVSGDAESGREPLRASAARVLAVGLTTALAIGATVAALIAITDRPDGHARPMPACELDDIAEGHEKCPPPPKGTR